MRVPVIPTVVRRARALAGVTFAVATLPARMTIAAAREIVTVLHEGAKANAEQAVTSERRRTLVEDARIRQLVGTRAGRKASGKS